MINTTVCTRCKAKIDMLEGMQIVTCLAPVDEKRQKGHQHHILGVNESDPSGIEILKHFERKPKVNQTVAVRP